MTHHLSKSRFVAGCQCHDLLWWRVHEPDASELVPDVALEDIFEQGHEVGARAREEVPGGVLIDPRATIAERVWRTEDALDDGAPVLYEAALSADQVFVSIDTLERKPSGFTLIEVKSTTSVKDQHIPDVAVQLHVARRCGIPVDRVELMHLNRECRYPDLSDLFVREDVTAEAETYLPEVPAEIETQLAMLDGPHPETGFGEHCLTGYACPFKERCWPEETPDSVLTLYRLSAARKMALIESGVESIRDLQSLDGLSNLARRQVRAVKADSRIFDRTIGNNLAPFEGRLAFLDFETVSLAIPVWNGCGPWAAMPVQFSCHRDDGAAGWEHHEFLAEDGTDCRDALAAALLSACDGADAIVTYNASFEKRCIRQLVEAVPEQAGALEVLLERIVDLLPVVRNNVYDPEFFGSFSLKSVLPALVPDLGYDDLEIAEGQIASLYLARLLFRPELIDEADRPALRRDLLEYCKRDTWATVRLLETLRDLAREADEHVPAGPQW